MTTIRTKALLRALQKLAMQDSVQKNVAKVVAKIAAFRQASPDDGVPIEPVKGRRRSLRPTR